MDLLFILLGALGVVGTLEILFPFPKCPREILGYHCKLEVGKECDHSDKARQEAVEASWRDRV